MVTVFSFVSCLVSCSNEKVVNNNNYSEQEKAKIEALMKLFDSYGWELDTTVSIEQRDKELLEMDYERAKTFLEYMSNGIEFEEGENTLIFRTPNGTVAYYPPSRRMQHKTTWRTCSPTACMNFVKKLRAA